MKTLNDTWDRDRDHPHELRLLKARMRPLHALALAALSALLVGCPPVNPCLLNPHSVLCPPSPNESPSPTPSPSASPTAAPSPSPCICPGVCKGEPSYVSSDPYCRCEPPEYHSPACYAKCDRLGCPDPDTQCMAGPTGFTCASIAPPSPRPTPTPAGPPVVISPQPTPAPTPTPPCAPPPPAAPAKFSSAPCARGFEPVDVLIWPTGSRTVCVVHTTSADGIHGADGGQTCAWATAWVTKEQSYYLSGGLLEADNDLKHVGASIGCYDAYCRPSRDCATVDKRPAGATWNDWTGNAQPDLCQPQPSPQPSAPAPSPMPTPTPGTSDVNNLLVLNYGKCVVGKPFVFYLGTDCKELLVTATPKSATQCDGKACDAQDPSRALTWTAGGEVSPDDGDVNLGCATVSPGPIELTFNRTIVGRSACTFPLVATFVDSSGRRWVKSVQVVVQ